MLTRDAVDAVLGRVRPFLVADGGNIELVDVGEHSAVVRLTGACASCPSAQMTLDVGVERALRAALPDFVTLQLV